MILMPKHFDANEWFVILVILVGYTLLWLLPKRFSRSVTVMIVLYCFFVSNSMDELLAAPPYDLYDINDTPEHDIVDMVMWSMYGPFGYLYLYLYDRWRLKGLSVVVYIIICALFSTGVEWLAVWAHIFKYHSWRLIYSFPVYIYVCGITILYFHFIQALFHKKTME